MTLEKHYNGLFHKKSKQGWGVEDILFWKAPLESLDLSLYPKKFQRKKAFTPGNSVNLCDTPWKIPKWKIKTHENFASVFLEHPWNFYSFFNWPLEFPHVFSSSPRPVWIFFWNSPMSDGMVSHVCCNAIKLLDVYIVTYYEPTYPVWVCCNIAILFFSLWKKLKCKSKC